MKVFCNYGIINQQYHKEVRLVKLVRFNIFRKAAFAGALLPYNIYINGKFVGTIKNGKTMNIEVPEADVYYLEDNNSFERNAVIINSNINDYNILIKRAGGWRTDSYNEFYIDNGDTIDQLPSFHFERFMNAVFDGSIDQLSLNDQILALCLNFSYSITDDIQEVLASSNFSKTIDALGTIGANQYIDLITQVVDKYFNDVSIPLNDEQIEQMFDRLNEANQLIWKNEGPAYDELHKVMVRYITEKLNNPNNIY